MRDLERNNPPVRRARAVKDALIDELRAGLAAARLVIVVDFIGVNGPKTGELHRELERLGGRYVVVKNTLVRHALPPAMAGLTSLLVGPCALVIADDRVDDVLLGFADYLAHRFPQRLLRNSSATDSIRFTYGGTRIAPKGGRAEAHHLEIQGIWYQGHLLSEHEYALLRHFRGLAGLRASLLRALQAPAAGLLATLAAGPQGFVAVLHARSRA